MPAFIFLNLMEIIQLTNQQAIDLSAQCKVIIESVGYYRRAVFNDKTKAIAFTFGDDIIAQSRNAFFILNQDYKK